MAHLQCHVFQILLVCSGRNDSVQVLDLVHPSLFPLVAGISKVIHPIQIPSAPAAFNSADTQLHTASPVDAADAANRPSPSTSVDPGGPSTSAENEVEAAHIQTGVKLMHPLQHLLQRPVAATFCRIFPS
jgi:hypothetical protein